MPILTILGFLFGDRHLYDRGFRRIIPLFPRLTVDGWLIWLWPVWREDSSSGGGWDESWAWDYHRKLPSNTRGKPIYSWPGLGLFDKWVLWLVAFFLICHFRVTLS